MQWSSISVVGPSRKLVACTICETNMHVVGLTQTELTHQTALNSSAWAYLIYEDILTVFILWLLIFTVMQLESPSAAKVEQIFALQTSAVAQLAARFVRRQTANSIIWGLAAEISRLRFLVNQSHLPVITSSKTPSDSSSEAQRSCRLSLSPPSQVVLQPLPQFWYCILFEICYWTLP